MCECQIDYVNQLQHKILNVTREGKQAEYKKTSRSLPRSTRDPSFQEPILGFKLFDIENARQDLKTEQILDVHQPNHRLSASFILLPLEAFLFSCGWAAEPTRGGAGVTWRALSRVSYFSWSWNMTKKWIRNPLDLNAILLLDSKLKWQRFWWEG